MKIRTIFLVIILQIGVIGIIFLLLPQNSNNTTPFTTKIILEEINQQREIHNLPKLKKDKKLERAANERAKDILKTKDFSHFIPEEEDPWKHIENQDYIYTFAAENLGINYTDTANLIDAWMQSEGHKQNILSTKAQDTGIAVKTFTENNKTSYLVVELFGSTTE